MPGTARQIRVSGVIQPITAGIVLNVGATIVFEIVDPRANVIDARFPLGDATIIKISSDMNSLVVTPAELSSYKQYENSDCLNGAILRVQDGYRFVESTPSHHVIIAVGDLTRRLQQVAPIWGLELDVGPVLTTPSLLPS